MSLVEIVCDGGPSQGCGHLRRSLALAQVLEERHHRVRVKPLSASGAKILADARAPNSQGAPDLLLFDLPDTIDAPIADACDGPIPTLALDYFGQARPTLTISVRERGETLHGRRESGLEYAIVRDEIRQQDRGTTGRGVLLMLGGSDVRGLTTVLAAALVEQGAEVTVVLGPYAPEPGYMGNVQVFRNPPNLPERMANTRWAVSSGGVSMTELMYLGKAVHVAAQSEAEFNLANLVLQQGGLLGVGLESLRVYTEPEVEKVAGQASKIVDGLGAERIAQRIEALL